MLRQVHISRLATFVCLPPSPQPPSIAMEHTHKKKALLGEWGGKAGVGCTTKCRRSRSPRSLSLSDTGLHFLLSFFHAHLLPNCFFSPLLRVKKWSRMDTPSLKTSLCVRTLVSRIFYCRKRSCLFGGINGKKKKKKKDSRVNAAGFVADLEKEEEKETSLKTGKEALEEDGVKMSHSPILGLSPST